MSELEPIGAAPLAPLLEADELRVAVDDVVVLDRASFTTRGDRVLVLGEAAPLLAAIMGTTLGARGARSAGSRDVSSAAGECRVVAGRLRCAGLDVARGEHLARIGAAPLDPPLPPRFTALEYVTWSARLTGASASAARALATAALAKVGLESARDTSIARLPLVGRRGLVLAHAIVTDPAVLVADAPLEGLEPGAAALVTRALAAATTGRGAIVGVPRLDPASPVGALAAQATDVLLVSGGQLVLHASGAELGGAARLYAVTVRTNAEPLRGELAARGIELRGGPERFSAALPEGAGAPEILAAAAAARAAVVEVRPLL